MEDANTEFGVDEALALLAHNDRRLVLEQLDCHRETMLAELLDETGLTSESLYHHHLPALESNEVITWNESTGLITAGPRFDVIRPLLRFVSGLELAQ